MNAIIDLRALAERIEYIAPAVGRLRGDRVIHVDPRDKIAVSNPRSRSLRASAFPSWSDTWITATASSCPTTTPAGPTS
jgi:hypothetical protein